MSREAVAKYLNEIPQGPPQNKGKNDSKHKVFAELHVLIGQGDERAWKEVARWIKYEESVQDGADRWGKPHISAPTFRSLINLRRLLLSGLVLFDVDEKDLPGLAATIVDQLSSNKLIYNEEKTNLLESLLLKHKYVTGKRGKKVVRTSVTVQEDDDDEGSGVSVLSKASRGGQHLALDLSKLKSDSTKDPEIAKWIRMKHSRLMRKIPVNAEASVTLVGIDNNLRAPCLAFVRLAESIYMPNITQVPIPVRFATIVMGPKSNDFDYQEVGRSMSTLLCNPTFQATAYKATDKNKLIDGIHAYLYDCVVIPPGDWDPDVFPFHRLRERSKLYAPAVEGTPEDRDPFQRTKTYFGGAIDDLKYRYRFYTSDLLDGINIQCLATIIFLYFACVAGSIIFGILMDKNTEKKIDIQKTLIGSMIAGIIMALFGCQPLLIVGATGPTYVFETALFKTCKDALGIQNLEVIMALRTWIGIWLAVIALIVTCFQGSVLIKHFTRFTQEVFSVLISIVFIKSSISELNNVYKKHHVSKHYNKSMDVCFDTKEHKGGPCPNIALFSTILMASTFIIAWYFRGFKTGTFLTKLWRKLLGNFAVLIAIVLMSLFKFMVRDHVDVATLKVPMITSFEFPSPYPENMEVWLIILAIAPAIILYIIIFIETAISELVIGKREHKLKKGSGFHADILLICLINTIMGFLGTCWISSAIVRAMAHFTALIVLETNSPPGVKPVIIGLKEQRVTAFFVSLLVGLSVLLGGALKLVPDSVMFGVFLYMGISSLVGVQFVDRIFLLFKQVENHPQVGFVTMVQRWKMNVFTGIQIIALGILCGINESPAKIALPIFIMLLVPFRKFALPFLYKPEELAALDAKGAEPDPIPTPISEDIDETESKTEKEAEENEPNEAIPIRKLLN